MKKEKVEQEELFIPKTKHKFLKILLALIIIGGIGVGGYFLYQEKFNDPKSIVRNVLGSNKNSVSNSLIANEDLDKYKINGIVRVDADLGKINENVTNILKDITLQFGGEVDFKESIANIEINTKYKNERLIDLSTYFENGNTYLHLDDIFNKYIKFDNMEDGESIKDVLKNIKLKQNELNTIINSIKKSFKEEIMKYDFNKEDVVIVVDDINISTYDNYVILKNNEVSKLASSIIKYLANDNDAIKAIETLFDEKNVKEILNELSTQIEKEEYIGTYRFDFYTDKGLFNKDLIGLRIEISQNSVTSTINIGKLEDGIFISASSMGTSCGIKVIKNNSNINFTIKLRDLENDAKIDISVNYEKVDKINKPDISKSVNLDKLTDEDMKKIEDGFSKNEVLKKLFDKIKESTTNELKA